MIDLIISAATSALFVAAVATAIHRQLAKAIEQNLRAQTIATNNAERNIHLKEMEYLAERNRMELAHADVIAKTRMAAFEEGKKLARAEHELEVSMRLADQRSEFTDRLRSEREQSANEARVRLRAEFEHQTKLFRIKISPYVQLLTDNGIFKNTHEAKLGYQYQLLVNGIPAFQPHIFVERHEKIDQIDQQVKDRLLSIAQKCAETAVETYLGGSSQYAKLASGIVDQID